MGIAAFRCRKLAVKQKDVIGATAALRNWSNWAACACMGVKFEWQDCNDCLQT